LQQKYLHTYKACPDFYFEIAMNMNKKVETSVCFHAKSSKDCILSIILEKKVWKCFKYKEKIINSPFVMWHEATV